MHCSQVRIYSCLARGDDIWLMAEPKRVLEGDFAFDQLIFALGLDFVPGELGSDCGKICMRGTHVQEMTELGALAVAMGGGWLGFRGWGIKCPVRVHGSG
jgi:hypothetical protein